MSDTKKFISINPLEEGIVNRVAKDTVQTGNFHFKGGLWVEGTMSGDIVVEGTLVLDQGADLSGRIRVVGPRAVLVGAISRQADGELSDFIVEGVAELGETLTAQANITAQSVDFFPGAQVDGKVKTGQPARDAVPE